MTTRTVLLVVHLIGVAGWLGADLVQYVVTPRLRRASRDVSVAWGRQQAWLHERYYAVTGMIVLLTGVALVVEVGWPWSTTFIWFGLAAIVGGAGLGRGVLRPMGLRQVDAIEAGDNAEAQAIERKARPLALVVTALPVLAIVAMVAKW
jgi:hypothetical protein